MRKYAGLGLALVCVFTLTGCEMGSVEVRRVEMEEKIALRKLEMEEAQRVREHEAKCAPDVRAHEIVKWKYDVLKLALGGDVTTKRNEAAPPPKVKWTSNEDNWVIDTTDWKWIGATAVAETRNVTTTGGW